MMIYFPPRSLIIMIIIMYHHLRTDLFCIFDRVIFYGLVRFRLESENVCICLIVEKMIGFNSSSKIVNFFILDFLNFVKVPFRARGVTSSGSIITIFERFFQA